MYSPTTAAAKSSLSQRSRMSPKTKCFNSKRKNTSRGRQTKGTIGSTCHQDSSTKWITTNYKNILTSTTFSPRVMVWHSLRCSSWARWKRTSRCFIMFVILISPNRTKMVIKEGWIQKYTRKPKHSLKNLKKSTLIITISTKSGGISLRRVVLRNRRVSQKVRKFLNI